MNFNSVNKLINTAWYSLAFTRICDDFTVGEMSGKANKGTAKYSAGTAGMAQAQERSGAACSEIGRAKMVSWTYTLKLMKI